MRKENVMLHIKNIFKLVYVRWKKYMYIDVYKRIYVYDVAVVKR